MITELHSGRHICFSATHLDTRVRMDQNTYSPMYFAILALVDLTDPERPQKVDLENFHAQANQIVINEERLSRAIDELNQNKSRPQRLSYETRCVFFFLFFSKSYLN